MVSSAFSGMNEMQVFQNPPEKTNRKLALSRILSLSAKQFRQIKNIREQELRHRLNENSTVALRTTPEKTRTKHQNDTKRPLTKSLRSSVKQPQKQPNTRPRAQQHEKRPP